MTKPKDRRNEFNRQHAKILAEGKELRATIELLSATKDAEISAAIRRTRETAAIAEAQATAAKEQLAEVQTALKGEQDRHEATALELFHARVSKTDLELRLQAIEADTQETMEKQRKAHAAEISALQADVARLQVLFERTKESMKRKHREEAAAILNRHRLVEVCPASER